MQLTTSKALYAYWIEIKGDKQIPTRADLKPGPISALLPDLFILDWNAEQTEAHFRLAGTRVCTMMGAELAAEAFGTLWAEDERESIAHMMVDMMLTGIPLVLALSGERRDQDAVRFEMLVLPLAGEDGLPSRVVGSLVPENTSAWQMLNPIEQFVVTDWSRIGAETEVDAVPHGIETGSAMRTLLRRFVPFQRKATLTTPPPLLP